MQSDLTFKHAPGDLIDQKYELRSSLGSGGGGAVFLARHVYMERDVAIKMLHPSYAADEALRSRFLREAKLTSSLRHPNIVTVHDFGISDDMPYLVMEYVKGRTLRSVLVERGTLSVLELTSIGLQVTRALMAAHEVGVVHRDLKPENIIVCDGGDNTIRVLDFGIAKLFDAPKCDTPVETLITEEGVFHGTPRYVSPEQILNKNVDGRADIYSLGVMLYEGFLGVPPFEAGSNFDLALMHLNAEVTPPRVRRPELFCPDYFDTLIMRCLEKDAQRRFKDVATLHGALERFSRNEKVFPDERPYRAMAGIGVLCACLLLALAFRRPYLSADGPELLIPPRPLATEQDLDEGLVAEGQRAYHEGRYNDAAPILRSVVKKYPGNVPAKLYLALTYKKTGRVEESISLLETLDPSLQENQKVAYQLAKLNAQVGRLDNALKHLGVAADGNDSIKARAKSDPAFESLRKDKRYRKILDLKESRPRRPQEERSSLEKAFGRMLEGANRGMNGWFD